MFSTFTELVLNVGLLRPTSAFTPNLTCEKAGKLSIDSNVTIAMLKIVFFVFIVLQISEIIFSEIIDRMNSLLLDKDKAKRFMKNVHLYLTIIKKQSV